MVKIWRPDLDYGYAEGGIVDNEQGSTFESVYLNSPTGQKIQGAFSNLKMQISTEPPNVRIDYFTCGALLMVSDALKAVLEEFRVSAQYISFGILVDGKPSDRAFFCCNILDTIECLDFDRGEYTFWQKAGFSDHVDRIKKLAIDENKVVGYHLFRIAKGAEYLICVSDILANRIAEAGFCGIRFVSPEEWSFC